MYDLKAGSEQMTTKRRLEYEQNLVPLQAVQQSVFFFMSKTSFADGTLGEFAETFERYLTSSHI